MKVERWKLEVREAAMGSLDQAVACRVKVASDVTSSPPKD